MDQDLDPRGKLGKPRDGSGSDSGSLANAQFPPYRGAESFVFVSYSHRDTAVVFREIERLHSQGVRLWYDEGIDPGSEEWPEEIAKALEGAGVLLFFLSAASVASKHCRREFQFADDANKPIVPVYLEDAVLPGSLKLQLSIRQALFRHKLSREVYEQKLLTALTPWSTTPLDPRLHKKELADHAQAAPAENRVTQLASAPRGPAPHSEIKSGAIIDIASILARYAPRPGQRSLPGKLSSERVYFAPDIPERKLLRSRIAVKCGVPSHEILTLVDTSIFGNATAGALLTDHAIHARNALNPPVSINYRDIEFVFFKPGFLCGWLVVNNKNFLRIPFANAEYMRLLAVMINEISVAAAQNCEDAPLVTTTFRRNSLLLALTPCCGELVEIPSAMEARIDHWIWEQYGPAEQRKDGHTDPTLLIDCANCRRPLRISPFFRDDPAAMLLE